MSFLQKMRKKSELEKRAFSFLVSLIITSIILFIWGFNTFYKISSNLEDGSQIASPVNALFNNVKSIFSNGEVYNAE